MASLTSIPINDVFDRRVTMIDYSNGPIDFHGPIAWRKDNETRGYRWAASLDHFVSTGHTKQEGLKLKVYKDISDEFNSPFYITATAEFPIVDNPDHGGRNKELVDLLAEIGADSFRDITYGRLPRKRKFYGDDDFPERFAAITRISDRMWMTTNRQPHDFSHGEYETAEVDAFYASFSCISLSMLRRYWNKTVNLKSRPRIGKGKYFGSLIWKDLLFNPYSIFRFNNKEIPVSPSGRRNGLAGSHKFAYDWIRDNGIKKVSPLSEKPFFEKENEDFLFLMDAATLYGN